MNKILSLVRRCVEDYEMIQPGDRIAVGVSGGKDSLLLLVALAKLREFYPVPYTVEAITLDMGAADGRPGMDFTPIAELCKEKQIPLYVTALSDRAVDLREADLNRAAMVIGSEGRGVGEFFLTHADLELIIPMSARCESLNAAIAAAIVMWEMKRNCM